MGNNSGLPTLDIGMQTINQRSKSLFTKQFRKSVIKDSYAMKEKNRNTFYLRGFAADKNLNKYRQSKVRPFSRT